MDQASVSRILQQITAAREGEAGLIIPGSGAGQFQQDFGDGAGGGSTTRVALDLRSISSSPDFNLADAEALTKELQKRTGVELSVNYFPTAMRIEDDGSLKGSRTDQLNERTTTLNNALDALIKEQLSHGPHTSEPEVDGPKVQRG